MAQRRELREEHPDTFEVAGWIIGGNRTFRFDAEELDLSNIGFNSIPPEIARCTRLRKLDIRGNDITTIENLPDGLHTLDARNNSIRSLEGLPDGLKTIDVRWNPIKRLGRLPPYLVCIRTFVRHPIVNEINSGRRAAEQWKYVNERRGQILLDFLSCCPLV